MFQIYNVCVGLGCNHMSHDSLEMKDVILVHSVDQHLTRFHASVVDKVDGQIHAIQILGGHYSIFHTTICSNEVLLGSLKCFLLGS